MSETVEFFDIIEPRRKAGDIFRFLTKYWYPKKTFTVQRFYSPQDLKIAVLNSSYIDSVLEAESIRTGTQKEKLKQEIACYLEEMGLDKKHYVIRWLGIIFLKIALMMKVRVFVNEGAVLQLKQSMGTNPVLFLPTHRSYADFCLMTYLCFHYDIEFPAVAAGMDFYSMAVLGRGLRETCAFYIRRTLVGAPLYAATLARYMRELIVHHAAPIEFFLEGTRSRSNKSLSPKYGMLSMSLAALFAGEVSDITIVPINISYDRLMEQMLFAYEHLGVPKPKESTGGFLKALNFLNDHFGNIYINLGKPLSVKNFFGNKLRVSKETLNPVEMQQMTSEQFALVQELANYVVFLQQKTMVVTISNLLALTLMHSIMRNILLNMQELALEIEWAIDVLTKLDVTIFETDIKASIERILLVHHKTVKLDNNDNLRLIISDSTPIIMGESTVSKMKGHILKPSTMCYALPLIQLQLYVNPLLHYLAPPAIIAVIVERDTISIDQLAIEFNMVRKMLKYELLYLELEEEMTFKKAFQFCTENDVITMNNNMLVSNAKTKVKQLLQWTVWPSLTILLKCMEILKECISCEHKTALRLVQERVEKEGRWHPYCLSLEASANCLMGLHASSAVIKEKKNEETLYTVVPNVMEEKYQLIKSILPFFDVPLNSSNSVYYIENVVASKL